MSREDIYAATLKRMEDLRTIYREALEYSRLHDYPYMKFEVQEIEGATINVVKYYAEREAVTLLDEKVLSV
jgi:hypothetical protein